MAARAPQEAKSPRAPAGAPAPRIRLTAAGAALVVLIPTVLGGLADSVVGVGYGALTGVSFLTGCVVAATRTRVRDLPILALSPPSLFVFGVAAVEALHSWGTDSWMRQEILAVVTALAGNALWIAAGTAATAVISASRWLRGPQRR